LGVKIRGVKLVKNLKKRIWLELMTASPIANPIA